MKKNGLRLPCVKGLFVFCILFLLLLLLPIMSCAYEWKESESGEFLYKYRELPDGTLELTGLSANKEYMDIVLPQKVGSKIVSSLNGSFGLGNPASVTIPNEIVSIKGNPFFNDWILDDGIGEFRVSPDHPTLEVKNGCLIDKREKKIIAVSVQFTGIPDGVEILGKNCRVNLVRLNIPDHVTTIEHGAFAPVDCPDSLRKVTIPNTVTKLIGNPFSSTHNFAGVRVILEKDHPTLEISNGALYDKTEHRLIYVMESKSSLVVLPGTEKIEDKAFSCGPGVWVSSVTLPDSIKSLGEYAFDGSRLTKINLPEELETIGKGCFEHCQQLKSISIPEGVKIMDLSIFFDCCNLEKVSIPDSVTEIGEDAFGYCKKLKNIIIPESVKKIGNYAFDGCINLGKVNIPDGVTEIGENTFGNCEKLKSIFIPESVVKIGDRAFLNCQSLEKVNIPENVTEIGNGAFSGCIKLQNITIPDNVTYIGSETFANCIKLENITIPESVTEIWEGAFSGCTKLKSIIIPENVKKIEAKAFEGCKELAGITIPDSVKYLSEDAFKACTKLKDITIGKGLTAKDNFTATSVFDGCNNMESLTMTGNINRLFFRYDFRDKIKTVTLGEETTEIESKAFSMFTKLEKVILPDSVTLIGEGAFTGCEKLKSINLPGGLKEMAGKAIFQNCVSLESITIPGSVQCIGENAFEGCKKLKNVEIEDGVKEIRSNAFVNCPSLKTITIPESVDTITDAFDPSKIKMIVVRDSYAEQYCIENSISYSYADEV